MTQNSTARRLTNREAESSAAMARTELVLRKVEDDYDGDDCDDGKDGDNDPEGDNGGHDDDGDDGDAKEKHVAQSTAIELTMAMMATKMTAAITLTMAMMATKMTMEVMETKSKDDEDGDVVLSTQRQSLARFAAG
ncbi:hypothetical protein CBR_g26040 [Chara braunii]|uniref:Uncharacterized protein n=1 Tax=Chara braunii TaxID=69332 RepID=A0A388L7C4_CHABU|nr:hypothetical protein CBR_g26040 [Chara braunii]|eukprot:GBG78103.1 hypothetical protein CBR_g26040 [Chara braunii]